MMYTCWDTAGPSTQHLFLTWEEKTKTMGISGGYRCRKVFTACVISTLSPLCQIPGAQSLNHNSDATKGGAGVSRGRITPGHFHVPGARPPFVIATPGTSLIDHVSSECPGCWGARETSPRLSDP